MIFGLPTGYKTAAGRLPIGGRSAVEGLPSVAHPFDPRWWQAGGIAAADCVYAYQAKRVSSLAQSYINLANPGTYDVTVGAVPTWMSGRGWMFNAANSQYLIAPAYAQSSSWSHMVAFRNYVSGNNGQAYGFSKIGFHVFLRPSSGTNIQYANGNDSAGVSGSAEVSQGVLMASNTKAFLNGVDEGVALTANSFGASNQYAFIGARNNLGTPDRYFTGDVLAAAAWQVTLTDVQVQAVTQAVKAMMWD